MMCTIGLIMGKSMLAKFSIMGKKIPISHEVASVLANRSPITHGANDKSIRRVSRFDKFIETLRRERKKLTIIPFGTTTYALRQRGGYGSLWDGLVSILFEFVYHLFYAIFQVALVPDKFSRRYGKRFIRLHTVLIEMPTITSYSFISFLNCFCYQKL